MGRRETLFAEAEHKPVLPLLLAGRALVPWTPQWEVRGPSIRSTRPDEGGVDLMRNVVFSQAGAVDLTVVVYNLPDTQTTYGLACRDVFGENSRYQLTVDTGGTARIEKVKLGRATTLATAQASAAGPEHHLRATCVQPQPGQPVTLTLFLDSGPAASAVDGTDPLPGGRIGVHVKGSASFGAFEAVMVNTLGG